MKIFFGADHAGFNLKNALLAYVRELGYEAEDKGPFTFDEQDDYPDFMIPVAEEVAKNAQNARGIIMGGSGQGEAMTANRIKGVRAAVFYGGNLEIVRLSREHNDANVLSLAARFLSEDEAKKAVKLWLDTPFSGAERHVRRIKKIDTVN
ncbi:MAG: RpiB/LacA/LacB family sugar-phosphate isomerase [Parcubacteria group bacterium]|nr:RpiB/LacA/LacB family sugar-phosphate isomerase [Parcubacteria group bacterium]